MGGGGGGGKRVSSTDHSTYSDSRLHQLQIQKCFHQHPFQIAIIIMQLRKIYNFKGKQICMKNVVHLLCKISSSVCIVFSFQSQS